jgi:hypothetical protein
MVHVDGLRAGVDVRARGFVIIKTIICASARHAITDPFIVGARPARGSHTRDINIVSDAFANGLRREVIITASQNGHKLGGGLDHEAIRCVCV